MKVAVAISGWVFILVISCQQENAGKSSQATITVNGTTTACVFKRHHHFLFISGEAKRLPFFIPTVAIKRKGQSIVVQKTAVITNLEKQFVIRINHGNEVNYVDVEKGEHQTERVEVFGKLNLGDTIFNTASDEIKKKSKIKIIMVNDRSVN
jgi:hypothetical protein